MTTDKTAATADGTDAVTYTVTVKNASGQAVAGQTVSLSTNLGTLSAQSGTTDANGQVKVTLTSTTAGSATVTATAAGQNLTAPVVTFSAEVFTPTVTVDKTTAIADGTDAATYTLTLKDANNQPVAGKAVSWGINSDLGTLSAQDGITDANGQAQVKLTSTRAGTTTATVTVVGKDLVTPAVTFNPEEITGTVTVDKVTARADGTDSATYTVTVKNLRDQPVEGEVVSFATNLGTLSTQTATTDANGQVKVTLTSTTAGSARVLVSISGQNLSPPDVQFTAVYNMTLVNDKQSAIADGVDPITFTLTVTDASGQPAAGVSVNWSTDWGNLSSVTGVTDANGVLTVRLTSPDNEETQVVATVGDQSINAPLVVFYRMSYV